MRKLLFSVVAKDCRWDYFRGSGKGGQKRNKTSSGVRCTHIASGAVGRSDDTRSQHRNKRAAFRRMAESKKFMVWHRVETARRLGTFVDLDKTVDAAMAGSNIRVETRENGVWHGNSDLQALS